MQPPETTAHKDPLDILRRFVRTPLRSSFQTSSHRVLVETNDFNLLPVLPLDPGRTASALPSMEWKIVRDYEVADALGEPVMLSSDALTVVSMGSACLASFDHERRQLSCFVGISVDASTYREFLIPFFCRLTTDQMSARLAASPDDPCEVPDDK